MVDAKTEARTHVRNRQGHGLQLRKEILAAAGRILQSTGSDDAITLRAVAREAGITAPAIYAHFADRDAIRFTVIEDTFAELATALSAAAEAQAEPVERLRAVCRAYLEFAIERPHHYRVMFERHRAARGADAGPVAPDVQSIVGAEAFGALSDAAAACIASGASTAATPAAAATRIWIGLHGQATLRSSLPWFPWPDRDDLNDDVLRRLADLT